MSRVHEIPAALRSLDAADDHIDPASVRARADLQRILATDPSPQSPQQPWSPSADRGRRPATTARTTRRVALAAAMAAAVAAGMVAMPSLTGGDQAFATWTPVPETMSAQQRPEAGAACRENQKKWPGDYLDDLNSAEIAIAETRGVWTTVVLAGADGFSALCITDDSAHLFTRGMIGSIGVPYGADYASPEPREVFATDLGVGGTESRDISLAAGHAGSDVVAVVYRSQTHGDVAASVSHGRFALWMPGDELKDANAGDGVEVEVTYRDGSTGTSQLKL